MHKTWLKEPQFDSVPSNNREWAPTPMRGYFGKFWATLNEDQDVEFVGPSAMMTSMEHCKWRPQQFGWSALLTMVQSYRRVVSHC